MKFSNSNARGSKKRFKVEGKVWFGKNGFILIKVFGEDRWKE
jgi:hypothetical protein